MVVAAFPIAKLAALAFRQLSKPLANRIKQGAKSSPFFRTYVCMPPAQLYHWVEVNVKMRILNLGKPSEVPPLNEAMAIELGAELLGEMIIFASAAATLVAEYLRQARNERLRENAKEEKQLCLECEVKELQLRVEQQEAQIKHLTRLAGTFVVAPPPKPPPPPPSSPPPSSPPGDAAVVSGAKSKPAPVGSSDTKATAPGKTEPAKATSANSVEPTTVVGRALNDATASVLGKTLS
ncbi:optic atrophy 3 protein homolog [Dermacentor andersoni]|uniref:optic atrophy 3 protein homolog n=1 Tax=Dermacentor andersoni TaxID=34620 RepID=UPI002155EE37|nr:optic atrophy 3 protein homolog [Dermacentor andersoni]